MSVDLQEFTQIKKRVGKLQAEKNRAEGALETQMVQLKKIFACSSVEEAQELLGDLKKRRAELEEKHTTLMNDFKEKWKDEFEDLI